MAALFSGAMTTAGLGLIAAALTARASMLRATTGIRTSYRLLALGLLLGACTVAMTVHEMCRPAAAGRWTVLLIPLGAGLSLQALVLLGGVLRLAEAADGPGAAIRRCAEGLVIASSGAYVAWTLLIQPLPIDNMNGRLTYTDKVIGLLILAPSLLAISICATSAWRLRGGLGGLIALSILGIVAAAALLLAAAGCGDATAITIASGVYALALAAVAICVHRPPASRPAQVVRAMSSGTLIALVPVSCAIAACFTKLAIRGHSDNTSILISVVIGGALAGRHTLSMRDIRTYATELERRERLYRELAHTDPLTGLANRRSFVATLHEQVVGGPSSVVLAIDLDGFKNVNDLRGHDVGDAVLVEVAHRLRTNLRPDDIPARLGGDEFAIVLWLQPAEAAAAAGRLRAVLSRPYEVGDSIVYLSASIGLAVTEGSADVPELMRNADIALRFAKLRGKDRVEGYAEAFVAWLRRRNTVEAELRSAIRRGELSLLYQPVVALPSGLVVGAEALLRWHNADLGPVSPSEFIPIAEGSGLIDDIGRWVMAEACRQLSRWVVEGHRLWLSVNVSVRELHRLDYREQLADVIRLHHVPTDRLVLEVTEHAVAIDMDILVATLAALRDTGLRIALDDFGAGYSSLGQLHRLPIDILKVDSSIVSPSPSTGSEAGSEVGALADVVVRLGRRLGLDVIAEGVSDAEQRRVVEDAGCVLVQGELFAWPLSPEHLEALVANGPIVPSQRKAPGKTAAVRAEAPGPER